RLVGNPDDAADVTQDVYLRVVRKLGGFRHEASFSTWLNRVTTNVAMSTLKRRTRRFAVEGAVVPTDTRDPAPEPAERAGGGAPAPRARAARAGRGGRPRPPPGAAGRRPARGAAAGARAP